MLHKKVIGRVRFLFKPSQLSSPLPRGMEAVWHPSKCEHTTFSKNTPVATMPPSQRDSTGSDTQLLRLERAVESRAEATQIKLLMVWQEGGVSCGLLAPPPGLSSLAALPTQILLPGTRWLLPGQQFVPWTSQLWHPLPADRSAPVCS